MDAKEYIKQYGGKAGGIIYLTELGGFEENLLPLYYIPPERDPDNIRDLLPKNIKDMNWILRGSHPNDHEGLVDILETDKVIGFEKPEGVVMDTFWNNISCMRDNADHPEVHKYSEFEGQPYDGKIGIAVQPFNPSKFGNGSIIEHPHERETYLIDFVSFPYSYPDDDLKRIDRVVAHDTEMNEKQSDVDMHFSEKSLIEPVVELYQRVRETEFIGPNQSFQMEFGHNSGFFRDKASVLFYQARPFLPFQEPTFSLRDDGIFKYSCFGITPSEGIVLPVVKTNMGEKVNDIPYKFAWTIGDLTAPMSPVTRPKNMVAFIPNGKRVNSLEHNTYRWVRKAKVSVLDNFSSEHYHQMLQSGDHVKVISDGLYHEVEKVN